LLFEVETLKHASPATVSRCGMVYFDSKAFGWVPYMNSWINKKTKNEDLKDFLQELVESIVEPVLKLKKDEC
jgi:dynein heavy chain